MCRGQDWTELQDPSVCIKSGLETTDPATVYGPLSPEHQMGQWAWRARVTASDGQLSLALELQTGGGQVYFVCGV